MSNKSPIFPMNINNEPHHITHHYGFQFHPQFHYFQLLEEARQHKRDQNPSMDALHLKLQKQPIRKIHTRKRWWRNPLLFFRGRRGNWASAHKTNTRPNSEDYVHPISRPLSGPLYITESATPYRTTSRPSSSGQITPMKREMDIIPYISLRDLNMDHHHRISPMPMPIYLVT